MSFLQSLTEFFQNIFMSSSPEVQKRQKLRKIESEIKEVRPVIYKNDLVQPNFAEALRIMYKNTKSIDDLLSNTICSNDIQRNNRYTEQLLLTGYTAESQEVLESLNYDNEKQEAMNFDNLNHFFEKKHRELEEVVKQLNTADFVKIDSIIDKIKQLADICRYSYISAIKLFDMNFKALDDVYKPDFQPIPADMLETSLLDLYYVTADMTINITLSKAITAISELYYGSSFTTSKKQALISNLEKIESILNHIFTPDILIKLIRLSKHDPDFMPQKAQYHGNARQKFSDYLEGKFTANENRLKVEIKDETIGSEVKDLFGSEAIDVLAGYNSDTNTLLRQSSAGSFNWITPIEVTKTFLRIFYNDQVKALLNDIVIEGFFNNPTYKSDFSSAVYACNDSAGRIDKFEKSFARNGQFDEAVITGLIRDSHKDNDFALKLRDMVKTIDEQAKKTVQAEASNIYELYVLINEILIDSKKPNPDSISNLKVLMASSRNRDGSSLLDQQFSSWKIYLEIMKNYAIIGNIELNT